MLQFFRPLEWTIFQSFETEVEPVLKYLSGRVLNAGCGNRDIAAFLKRHHAEAVENCDVASSIPGAVICDLVDIPQAGATYDSVFCNAVLEHVQFAPQVVRELYRVLKPGGYAVLAIPFLQPFHPCPTDYRRFTHYGMIELGREAGFEVVEVLPVHSMAQTITWILWSCLKEKRRRVLQTLLRVPLYLWCKWSRRTDFSLKMNANAFQIVLRKPLSMAA
jgi:SAM-dependent methyltransferase